MDRRLVAAWAADCAAHVLWIFETELPGDRRPHELISRTRAFSNGEVEIAAEIKRRFGGAYVGTRLSHAAVAAVRAAGQASAVCHMGAHALGAAAYAVRAVGLADSNSDAAAREMNWQLNRMTAEVREALKSLPLIGEDRSGPLGPGLLASGDLGKIVAELQTHLASVETPITR
jgi:hypothetical protein